MITILTYKGQDPIVIPPDSTLLVSAATQISRREIERETDKPPRPSFERELSEMRKLQHEVNQVDQQVAASPPPNVNVIAHYPKPSFGTINIDRAMLREAFQRAKPTEMDLPHLADIERELFGVNNG